MTRDDIIHMARETGIMDALDYGECIPNECIERFAALVAASAKSEEREACAKVCEPKSHRPCDCDFCDCGNSGDRAAVADWDARNALADAIRARGETK